MKKRLLPVLCVILAALAIASTSHAGYKGSVNFTDADRARHAQGLPVLMKSAASCLQAKLAKHQQFIQRFGVSAFYGDNSSFAKKVVINSDGTQTKVETTAEDKRNQLRQMQVPESLVQQFVPQVQCFNVGEDTVPREIAANARQCQLAMEPTSCIGITLRCLGDAFTAAGQADLWAPIAMFTSTNGVQGDALQVALQQLGWKIVYWNPDLSAAERWDQQEQQAYPNDPGHIWGQHVETEKSVFGPRHNYLYERVDDWTTLVNFDHTEPAAIMKVPFFVGIAHLGYHVFPGAFGQIIEGHSTRIVNDPDTMQTSPFNPLVVGGGPRGGPYKSGVVAVPPGYLP
jgi:hypothetical protein